MKRISFLAAGRKLILGAAAALAAVSCATRQSPQPAVERQPDPSLQASQPSPAPSSDASAAQGTQDQPARAARPAVPPSARAPLLNLDAYKRAVARRIAESNTSHWFLGAPPAMLKSVVVLSIAVDGEGRVARVNLLRGNGHRALEALAMQSLREAQPLPRPDGLTRLGLAEFSETWLFRDDGRFQLRSIAEAQSDS